MQCGQVCQHHNHRRRPSPQQQLRLVIVTQTSCSALLQVAYRQLITQLTGLFHVVVAACRALVAVNANAQ